MTRPFRFGIQFGGPMDAVDWLASATRAEELGYSTINHADHFGMMNAPLPMLTAAAVSTSRLNVGTMVLCNDFYHPAYLARELSTLDRLSRGRLEVGIGVGAEGRASEFAVLERPLDSPGVRIERLEESLAILRGLQREEPFHFTGKHYTLPEYASYPQPFEPGGLTVMLGGASPRMLRLAGRLGDIASVSVPTPSGRIDVGRMTWEAVGECVGWIREGANGRSSDPELNLLAGGAGPAIVTDERQEVVAARFEQLSAPGLFPVTLPLDFGAEHLADSPFVLIGSITEIGEKLHRLRDEFGISYVTVEMGSLETFAPVVRAFAGK